MWNQECHTTVPWGEVDGILVQRSRRGSLIFEIASPVLGALGSAAAPVVLQRLRRRREVEYDDEFQADLEEVVPFITRADFFVGSRHHWDADDQIGPGDAQVVDLLTDFFTSLTIQVTQTYPSEISEVSEAVAFDRHLVSLGGPIPNWYSRNLMYGSDVDLPYRFCLNPEPDRLDLSGHDPLELRELGRRDFTEFVGEPNWYLADESGDRAVVDNAEAVPQFRETPDGPKPKHWYRDYFTIVKAPNVHPDAGPRKKSLCMAGCHGLGGLAAIHALQDPELVARIRREAGDGHFQAVGRVQETSTGDYRITLPIVEPL